MQRDELGANQCPLKSAGVKALDLFDLNEPKDLFGLLREAYVDFSHRPTERDFLLLALGLTHLREWLVERRREKIEVGHKKGQRLSAAEQFFLEIQKLPEFHAIRNLCNRSKHHITKHGNIETSKTSGFRAGLSRAGDRLGQTYFLVDGRDSRLYFNVLIQKYSEWFNAV